MKALVVYYSITGRNRQLAEGIQEEIARRGHTAEIHGLTTVVPLSALTGVLKAVSHLPAKLADPPSVNEVDLLVIVEPVWASTLCPAVRAFLNTLKELRGKRVINLLVGNSAYDGLARKIDHTLKDREAEKIVSEALRLKDTDTREKIRSIAARVVTLALA